jgi:16S rRNA (uracil1498-N3)-methyltransferase
MELFYCNNIEIDKAYLDERESAHCIRVLRHKAGDELIFTDGNGKKYFSKIENANAKKCELQIESSVEEKPRDFNLHVAIAPPKAIDRFEWFLEKATELGVEEITPLLSCYSERKHLNHERCEKILISAMKQSNRLYLPRLNEMISFQKFLEKDFSATKAIAYCETSKKKSLQTILVNTKSLLVLIGPEGDFSKEEIEFAISKIFESISLGEKRLRTETAAVHVCSAANLFRGV